MTSVIAFLVVIALSAIIIFWAARRNMSVGNYYTAGGHLSAWQNGLALAGDFISAGGFLGLTGLVAVHGLDAAVYAVGVLCSWPLMLLLFAGPLQRMGKYTLADVLTSRLKSERLRVVAAGNQLVILLLGLTSNLVGSMLILQLLFAFQPLPALMAIGALMLAYVLLGGMAAATWLQIVKAVLLMVTMLVILVLCLAHFHFSLDMLLGSARAASAGTALRPAGMHDGGFATLSLLFSLALGGASMPHILMRMNTVASPAVARQSAFLATIIVVVFHVMLVFVGLAAMVLLPKDALMDGASNMTLPRLGGLVAGEAMLGVISAMAVMTMLAVMTGQCIAGSAAIAHDIWAKALRAKDEHYNSLFANRVGSVVLLTAGTILAYLFRSQNISFIAASAMAIAASANFPVLVLCIFWRRLTTAGAVAGMGAGLVTSIILIYLSPLVQQGVLDRAEPTISLHYPAIISMPIALVLSICVSLITSRRGDDASAVESVPSYTLPVMLAAGAITLFVSFALAVGDKWQWLETDISGNVTGYAILLAAATLAATLLAAGYFIFIFNISGRGGATTRT